MIIGAYLHLRSLRKGVPWFRKGICLLTVLAFIASTLLGDHAWAATVPINAHRHTSGNEYGLEGLEGWERAAFSLPAYLGTIRERYDAGEGSNTVIHIQDAHCNYACQMSISGMIGYLSSKYGIRAVNLEGGAGEYDLSIFTRIQDNEIRRKVADHFVKEGLVNGAEFFAINNPGKVDLWGVEDVDLYLANLNAYRDSFEYRDEVTRHLKTLKHALNNLKRHMYSPDMFEFDLKNSSYRSGNTEFRDYLSWLIFEAQERAIDIKQFTSVYLLSQTMAKEEEVDFSAADLERGMLIDRVRKEISVVALEELALKTVEFRSERISKKDFYAYLAETARNRGIGLEEFPELKKYMVYVAMYEAVDKTRIMQEIASLEDVLRGELCRTDEEKELALLSKHLGLIESLFDVRLTKEEYGYYTRNRGAFDARNFTAFIEKHAPRYGIAARIDARVTDLDAYRQQLVRFYEYSFKRDKAFVENLLLQNPEGRNDLDDTAIIVTGGFHTANLVRLFRERGISYVSVMPQFASCPDEENPYFALLGGNSDSVLVRIQEFIHSTLAIASFLNSALSDALPEAGTRRLALDIFARWKEERVKNNVGTRGKEGVLIRHGESFVVINWAGVVVSHGEGAPIRDEERSRYVDIEITPADLDDQKFRESLARQGMPLGDLNVTLGGPREVTIEPAPGLEHLPLFIDVSEDLSTVRYYHVPERVSLESFLDGLDNETPFLEVNPSTQSQYLITPSDNAMRHYLSLESDENRRQKIQDMMYMGTSYTRRYVRYGPSEGEKVITTWDAAVDKDVWSTMVDTVYMHKMISEAGIFDARPNNPFRSVLEVGSGSGHITAALAGIRGLTDLYYSDVSPYALRATMRHVSMAAPGKGFQQHSVLGPGLRHVRGPESTRGKFDLIIMNPPYIPVPEHLKDPEKVDTPYDGTGLVREVFECVSEKLNENNPDAQALMIVSSMTELDMPGYVAQFGNDIFIEPLGPPLEVPLKIVTRSDEWKDWFVSRGLIRKHENAEMRHMEPYSHNIQVYRIRRRDSQVSARDKDDRGAIVTERLKNLNPTARKNITRKAVEKAIAAAFHGDSAAQEDFLENFAGDGAINYQVWHTSLPEQLTLMEQIKLMYAVMRLVALELSEAGVTDGAASVNFRGLKGILQDDDNLSAVKRLIGHNDTTTIARMLRGDMPGAGVLRCGFDRNEQVLSFSRAEERVRDAVTPVLERLADRTPVKTEEVDVRLRSWLSERSGEIITTEDFERQYEDVVKPLAEIKTRGSYTMPDGQVAEWNKETFEAFETYLGKYKYAEERPAIGTILGELAAPGTGVSLATLSLMIRRDIFLDEVEERYLPLLTPWEKEQYVSAIHNEGYFRGQERRTRNLDALTGKPKPDILLKTGRDGGFLYGDGEAAIAAENAMLRCLTADARERYLNRHNIPGKTSLIKLSLGDLRDEASAIRFFEIYNSSVDKEYRKDLDATYGADILGDTTTLRAFLSKKDGETAVSRRTRLSNVNIFNGFVRRWEEILAEGDRYFSMPGTYADLKAALGTEFDKVGREDKIRLAGLFRNRSRNVLRIENILAEYGIRPEKYRLGPGAEAFEKQMDFVYGKQMTALASAVSLMSTPSLVGGDRFSLDADGRVVGRNKKNARHYDEVNRATHADWVLTNPWEGWGSNLISRLYTEDKTTGIGRDQMNKDQPIWVAVLGVKKTRELLGVTDRDFNVFFGDLITAMAATFSEGTWNKGNFRRMLPWVSDFIKRVKNDRAIVNSALIRQLAGASHDTGYYAGESARIRDALDPFIGGVLTEEQERWLRGVQEDGTLAEDAPDNVKAYFRLKSHEKGEKVDGEEPDTFKGERVKLDLGDFKKDHRRTLLESFGKNVDEIQKRLGKSVEDMGEVNIFNTLVRPYDVLQEAAGKYPTQAMRESQREFLLDKQIDAIINVIILFRIKSLMELEGEDLRLFAYVMNRGMNTLWKFTQWDGWSEPLVQKAFELLEKQEPIEHQIAKDQRIWATIKPLYDLGLWEHIERFVRDAGQTDQAMEALRALHSDSANIEDLARKLHEMRKNKHFYKIASHDGKFRLKLRGGTDRTEEVTLVLVPVDDDHAEPEFVGETSTLYRVEAVYRNGEKDTSVMYEKGALLKLPKGAFYSIDAQGNFAVRTHSAERLDRTRQRLVDYGIMTEQYGVRTSDFEYLYGDDGLMVGMLRPLLEGPTALELMEKGELSQEQVQTIVDQYVRGVSDTDEKAGRKFGVMIELDPAGLIRNEEGELVSLDADVSLSYRTARERHEHGFFTGGYGSAANWIQADSTPLDREAIERVWRGHFLSQGQKAVRDMLINALRSWLDPACPGYRGQDLPDDVRRSLSGEFNYVSRLAEEGDVTVTEEGVKDVLSAEAEIAPIHYEDTARGYSDQAREASAFNEIFKRCSSTREGLDSLWRSGASLVEGHIPLARMGSTQLSMIFLAYNGMKDWATMQYFYETVRDLGENDPVRKDFLRAGNIREFYAVALNKQAEAFIQMVKTAMKPPRLVTEPTDSGELSRDEYTSRMEEFNNYQKALKKHQEAKQALEDMTPEQKRSKFELIIKSRRLIEELLKEGYANGELYGAYGKVWKNTSAIVGLITGELSRPVGTRNPVITGLFGPVNILFRETEQLPDTLEETSRPDGWLKACLEKELDGYRRGFFMNFEYYPGINAVYALIKLDRLDEARNMAQLVYYSAELAGGKETGNEWCLASMLQLALIMDAEPETRQEEETEAMFDLVEAYYHATGRMDTYAKYGLMGLMDVKKSRKEEDQLLESMIKRLEKLEDAEPRMEGEKKKKDSVYSKMFNYLGFNDRSSTFFIGGNFAFGGPLHDHTVTRVDIALAESWLKDNPLDKLRSIEKELDRGIEDIPRKIDQTADGRERDYWESVLESFRSLKSRIAEIKNKEVFKEASSANDIGELAVLNEYLDICIRFNFGTQQLEDLHGLAHEVFDARLWAIALMLGARITKDSKTNLMAVYQLGIGDCRQHAYSKQLFFDVWKSNRMRGLMQTFYDLSAAGQETSEVRQEIERLQNTQMFVLDTMVRSKIKVPELYSPTRVDGQYVYDSSINDVEGHTLNGLAVFDNNGDILEFHLMDSFYQGQGQEQSEYRWKRFTIIDTIDGVTTIKRVNKDGVVYEKKQPRPVSQAELLKMFGGANYLMFDFKNIEALVEVLNEPSYSERIRNKLSGSFEFQLGDFADGHSAVALVAAIADELDVELGEWQDKVGTEVGAVQWLNEQFMPEVPDVLSEQDKAELERRGASVSRYNELQKRMPISEELETFFRSPDGRELKRLFLSARYPTKTPTKQLSEGLRGKVTRGDHNNITEAELAEEFDRLLMTPDLFDGVEEDPTLMLKIDRDPEAKAMLRSKGWLRGIPYDKMGVFERQNLPLFNRTLLDCLLYERGDGTRLLGKRGEGLYGGLAEVRSSESDATPVEVPIVLRADWYAGDRDQPNLSEHEQYMLWGVKVNIPEGFSEPERGRLESFKNILDTYKAIRDAREVIESGLGQFSGALLSEIRSRHGYAPDMLPIVAHCISRINERFADITPQDRYDMLMRVIGLEGSLADNIAVFAESFDAIASRAPPERTFSVVSATYDAFTYGVTPSMGEPAETIASVSDPEQGIFPPDHTVLQRFMPILETPNNHEALVSAMSGFLQAGEVSELIKSIDVLPLDRDAEEPEKDNRRKKADLNMALRIVSAIDGIRHVDPNRANIVAQVAPIGNLNMADRTAREAARRLDRDYNGISGRNIIRGICDSSKDAVYEDLIKSVINAMTSETRPDARALFLVPATDMASFETAKKSVGSDLQMKKADWARKWESISVVPVDQGEHPDFVNHFIWGVQHLDDTRKVNEAEERGSVAPAPSVGYTRLTAALFEGLLIGEELKADAAEIIRILREGKAGTLVARKIDWAEIEHHYRAWQAVATSL